MVGKSCHNYVMLCDGWGLQPEGRGLPWWLCRNAACLMEGAPVVSLDEVITGAQLSGMPEYV